MMAEGEEAPAVRLRKALVVFNGDVDSVVCPVEISAARRLFARAVGECRFKNAGEFLYDDGPFRKLTRFQVGINIFLLDVDMVVFREIGLPIVEAIRSQWSTHKHPPAKSSRIW